MQSSEHKEDISVGLLIGRIPHVCQPQEELMTEDSQGGGKEEKYIAK